MIQITAKIISNQKLTPKYYRMSLICPSIARKSSPGEFINIDVASKEVFLRRPFSIYNVNGDKLEILYKVVGPGTEALAAKGKNEILNIIGPLGNGYKIPAIRVTGHGSRVTDNKRVILVAGGTGVASLFFLAKQLKNNFQIIILIGAKTKSELINIEEFKNLGCNVKIATDDGSKGYKGFVSELLNNLLTTIYPPLNIWRAGEPRVTVLYACGPKPMLKEIALISKSHQIPCQVSLEEHMACGVGACMGCVVKISARGGSANFSGGKTTGNKFEYKRVCKEGPVFDAQEVLWE